MSYENFKPEKWSQEVLYNLHKAMVGRQLVNTNYQGEISASGDTVHVANPDSVTVSNYSQNTDISFEQLTAAQVDLVIDQQKYFAFSVDDVDQAQANLNLQNTFMPEAGYALADELDQSIFAQYKNADINITKALTASNIYATLVQAGTALSENNVPSQGRFVVLSPNLYGELQQSAKFTPASDLGDSVVQSGVVGQAAGFNVFQSNNLAQTGSSTKYEYPLFGNNSAITLAEQILKTQAGSIEKQFGDYVKGLHVYGLKTIRPKALGYIKSKLS